MSEYHKIQTVYKRDPATKHKTLLEGEFSEPEFEYLKDSKWIWTEKVDGTNIRIYFRDGKVVFGGRTDSAQLPAPLVERLQEHFTVEKMEETFEGDACLYGEGYGPKIQKGGGNYRDDQDFVLFDVLIGPWWMQREAVDGIAGALEIDSVPIVGEGTLLEMVDSARNGVTSTWGDFTSEGYVARPAVEIKSRSGGRLITKIKCKDFAHG